MAVQQNDFVEFSYTGKADGTVFDTTDEAVAKESGIHDEKQLHSPVVICVGRHHVLPGLERQLIGKEVGQRYTARLSPEEAFGRKRADLIQLIPTSRFRKERILPEPGLRVEIDGQMGTVKTVSGGRTLVDFNYPLAGKDIEYEFTVTRVVTDLGERLKALLAAELGLSAEVKITGNDAEVALAKPLPGEFSAKLAEILKKALPELGAVTFATA